MQNLKQVIKKILFNRPGFFFLRVLEKLVFGGRFRRSMTRKLLAAQYQSKFRSDWRWTSEAPHFSDHERLESAFPDKNSSFYGIYRGVLTAEVLQHGNTLLDIGCGDGFFDLRFYSHKCKRIDAIDIDESAINYAKTYNGSENIHYSLLDAVNQPFPASNYDVIAWDGAIGHFSSETTNRMLEKISQAIGENGIFCGSESLGREGHDHLQFFETTDDLMKIFKTHFKYVVIKEASFPINSNSYLRREGYWRCSNSDRFKNGFDWVSS